jgi:hypothetical protein
MKGIQYVTDESGNRVAVQIDLKKYAKLWQDFHDSKLMDERLKEKFIPLDVVEKRVSRKKKTRS